MILLSIWACSRFRAVEVCFCGRMRPTSSIICEVSTFFMIICSFFLVIDCFCIFLHFSLFKIIIINYEVSSFIFFIICHFCLCSVLPFLLIFIEKLNILCRIGASPTAARQDRGNTGKDEGTKGEGGRGEKRGGMGRSVSCSIETRR